jgi:molybdopterin-guanine dinucleotide biosynthesis protein A
VNASVAILAGGQATRFGGRDKGSLLVGGLSILERQLREVSQVADEVLLVGAHAAPVLAGVPIRIVADRVTGAGPLGGLDAALAAAGRDHVMIIAGDMPYVSAQLVAFLTSLGHDADAVVPRTERGYHTLCAVYARSCASFVARRLAARAFAMKHLLGDVKVRAVDTGELAVFGDPDRLLANVNTPADLDRIEALAGHQP